MTKIFVNEAFNKDVIINVFMGQINGTTPEGTEPIFAALAVLDFYRTNRDLIPTAELIEAILVVAEAEITDVDSAERFVHQLTLGEDSWEDYYDSHEMCRANTIRMELMGEINYE